MSDDSWRKINPKASCKTPGCWGGKLPILQLDIPDFVAAWNTRAYQPPKCRDASRKKAKCLRDLEFDNNLQGPCSAGQCQFPDCVESPKGGDKE